MIRLSRTASHSRGGAGISKVVRPLQIKDQLYMCKGGGGGGSMRRARLRSRTTASSGMRHIAIRICI